jgi:hypothetical protein
MSKFSKTSKKTVSEHRTHNKTAVKNFMGGTSYTLNPLDTLRIVAASSIFGEPSYYRGSHDKPSNLSTLLKNDVLGLYGEDVESTTDVFTNVIDSALDYDFGGTLEMARTLRHEYFMRLNPAVIFIRAAQHPKRVEFNNENPGVMRKIGSELIVRPDDITNQFDYYMWLNVTKKGLPSIVKRVWADALGEFDAYRINKYKSKSLIDLVRISHAKSDVINELMTTGGVTVNESSQTWESLRSQGKTWVEIFDTIKIPHMALLRNLRGIFTEVNNMEFADKVCENLVSGVPYGKQFPFRYYTAYQMIDRSNVNHKGLILDALEECLDVSVSNLPKLEGKTICLSDNSGSAWGSLNSEYGTVTVAEIGNLSSIVTALQSDEGEVGVFGDRLSIKPVSSRNGILSQAREAASRGRAQGGATENGIWLFFRDAIKNKTHYDNIFVYSDMQAGHGGLFGVDEKEYKDYIYEDNRWGSHIDVLKLVQKYRSTVNPKVNIFTVQTAGYNNSVVPETLYRGAVLGGWTGKESTYAKALTEAWDQVESKVPVTDEVTQ